MWIRYEPKYTNGEKNDPNHNFADNYAMTLTFGLKACTHIA